MHKIKIIHRILVDNLKIKNTGLKKEAIQPQMIIKSFNCYNLFVYDIEWDFLKTIV